MLGMKWECMWGFLSGLVFCYFREVKHLMATLGKYQRQNSPGTYDCGTWKAEWDWLYWYTASCSVVQSCTLRERVVIWRKKGLWCASAPDSSFGNCRMTGVWRGLWSFVLPTPPAQAQLIAQVHVQMSFEYLQGWGLHRCSGQPMPVLFHPHSKRCLLIFRGNLLCLLCASCLLSCHWTPLKRAWLCVHDAILSGIYPHWLGTPCPEPSSGWTVPALPAFPHMRAPVIH